MPEANIIIKAIDQFSAKINSMSNANKGFNKSMEESQRAAQQLSQRQDALLRKQAELKTSLDAASKALKDAKKAFLETGDAAQQKDLQDAHENFDRLKESISGTTKELKDCRKEMDALEAQNRRSPGGSGGGSGGGSSGNLAATLGKSGLASAVGDWASDLAGIAVQSIGGDAASNIFSGSLSLAGTGAAIGTAIAPGIGTAIGAAIGAVAGAISGAAKNAAEKDEYFKSAAKDTYEEITQGFSNSMSNGISVAAQRETDALAFNKLLGEGTGTQFLSDLRDLAAKTPMEYGQLTEISRQLAIGFGDETDRMLELIEVVGDAGSAVGLDASGMQTIATALSRMQSSDKVTLEYLNLIQERGIDAIGIIGSRYGMTTAQVYDAISNGTLDGSDVVDVLQEGMAEKYGGAMQEISQTYAGLLSTVGDIETERDAAMGAAHNAERSKGLQADIAWDEQWGDEMEAAYAAMGSFHASMENKKSEIWRNAMATVLDGSGHNVWGAWTAELQNQLSAASAEYAEAKANGDEAGMGAAIAKAEAIAAAQYTQTEGYDLMVDAQMDTITAVQDATAESYWQAGYDAAQQWSKGYAAFFGANNGTTTVNPESLPNTPYFQAHPYGYAYGLDRVPYNGYPAMLHEGERVLTKQQARQLDESGHAGGVVISGNQFVVREEADIGRIASELARQIAVAKLSYAG